jgi:hypothetical protein
LEQRGNVEIGDKDDGLSSFDQKQQQLVSRAEYFLLLRKEDDKMAIFFSFKPKLSNFLEIKCQKKALPSPNFQLSKAENCQIF